MLSRHSGSVYYGLDQIIILRTTNEFFSSSLSKAPHSYMSLYTPSTQPCFLGCDLYGLHEWATTLFPATELYIHTWANRDDLYKLIIRQNHLHIHAWLPGVSYIIQLIYTYMFPGGELWARNEPARFGMACAKLWQRSKGCIAFDLTFDYITVIGFQSDHR